MTQPPTCQGCKFYVYNGIKRGRIAYSKCTRKGAVASGLAMEERKTGDCGPNALRRKSR